MRPAASLKARGVAFHYRILGIGPWERRLRTLIEQYELEDYVEMPGFKPSHEVKAMLDAADVFLIAVSHRYRWRYGRDPGGADGGDGGGDPRCLHRFTAAFPN
ncbi:colanic acid biosynthesis glycosyltransferase WcaL [Leclercia adecarboxylata]|uniref:Colanic acid biosynthesis glycosyltransferase WcaL n=1 Tax=Leclercia adecarboxylata TaxID=83655 RepID=A0A4U9I3L5_9ENTR|nr:colanic acid biosynthesis glycosyltransferase WcaL [Leclercia adecarboxylata]